MIAIIKYTGTDAELILS